MNKFFFLLILIPNIALAQPMLKTSTQTDYIGTVAVNDEITVRLLVLKHCPDAIADTDSGQAIQAARLAASKGLSIKDIGNHRIDKSGRTDRLVWGEKFDDLTGLKAFINEQMKIDAKVGDTLVIYTIGHGGGNGYIMRLGQRSGLMKIIAEAAEENDQETLWWQMSCHAAANLPPISSLTPRQQELFSMTASSPGNKLSYFNTQGRQFERLFVAMANKSTEIDPDQNQIITAKELSGFLIQHFGRERGELVFARTPDEPIFGGFGGFANRIPIRDHTGNQQQFPRNYIPIPRR